MGAEFANGNRMRTASSRSGATMVECAIMLPLLCLLLFALLDLAIATVRYNALAEAARRIAREAVIRGSMAQGTNDVWGPDEFDGAAADESSIVDPARGLLPTMNSSLVSVKVSWLDEDNAPRDRVRVEMSYRHDPLIPALFAWGPLNLTAVTTMPIVN